MNVLCLMGSPRKKGNTALLLNEYIRGINDGGNADVKEIILQDKKISPCISCNSCKSENRDSCVIKDDMADIYPLIKAADVIVLATPIYWWNVSAQMKIFIDRLYGRSKDVKMAEKKVVLLMTYGGALPNSGPGIVEKSISEICSYLNMDLIQVYGTCTDEYIPFAENNKGKEEVYNLGKSLANN